MTNFSDKEKDEAGLPDDFRQDSLDAFILRFAGRKAFLFFALVHVRVSAGQAVSRGRERGRERGRFISALVSQPKTRSCEIFYGIN